MIGGLLSLYGAIPITMLYSVFNDPIYFVFQVCDRSHVDDNGSEASAETNTVDSGKGSSVSDVMSPLPRDLGKHLDFQKTTTTKKNKKKKKTTNKLDL